MSPNPWRQTPARSLQPPHYLIPPLTPCCTVHSTHPSHAHSIPSAQHILPCTPPPASIHPPPSARVSPVHSQHFLGASFLTHTRTGLYALSKCFRNQPTTPSPRLLMHTLITCFILRCLLVCYPQQTVSSKMAKDSMHCQHSTWHTGGME